MAVCHQSACFCSCARSSAKANGQHSLSTRRLPSAGHGGLSGTHSGMTTTPVLPFHAHAHAHDDTYIVYSQTCPQKCPHKRLFPHRTRSCARHHSMHSQEHKPPPGTDPTPRNNSPQRASHPCENCPPWTMPCYAMPIPMSSLAMATRPIFWVARGPLSQPDH